MNIAVTGASGFLGRAFVDKLIRTDTNINNNLLILDRNPDRLKFNKDKNIEIIKYDLTTDIDDYLYDILYDIRDKLNSIDCLVHLAAFVPKSNDIRHDNIGESIYTNLIGTINLIELFKNLKQIVFASTLEVYGIPESIPIYEMDSTNPISYYGASKLACEKYLSIYGKRNNINVTILRFTTIYGPGEIYDRAIPNFMKNVINDKPPVIYGDGHEIRDYIYVDDAADAIILAINKNANGIYNIASGMPYTIKEIAELIIKISAKNSKVLSKDLEIIYEPRTKPYTYFDLDICAAKKDLGFHPKIDMIDGLTKEYKWYKNLE